MIIYFLVYLFLQVIVENGFNLFCSVNLIQWKVSKQTKKRASCGTHKKLGHIDYTVHLDGPRSPRVGRNCVLRGTCHMLSESGLKQKPVNASRTASQAARPFPERGRGAEAEGWRLLCVQACVVEICCKLTLLNGEMVAVATLWWIYDIYIYIFCDHLIKIHINPVENFPLKGHCFTAT